MQHKTNQQEKHHWNLQSERPAETELRDLTKSRTGSLPKGSFSKKGMVLNTHVNQDMQTSQECFCPRSLNPVPIGGYSPGINKS